MFTASPSVQATDQNWSIDSTYTVQRYFDHGYLLYRNTRDVKINFIITVGPLLRVENPKKNVFRIFLRLFETVLELVQVKDLKDRRPRYFSA